MTRRLAFLLLALALVLCFTSTAGSQLLLDGWERLTRSGVDTPPAQSQVVVVLTGRDTRLAHAAALARAAQLPLYLAGDDSAFFFSGYVARRYGVAPRWKENHSRDTQGNAAMAACILLPQGVRSIALVTDRVHMPRAALWFRHYGFHVTETPSMLPAALDRKPFAPADLLPSPAGANRLHQLLHELAGLTVYAATHAKAQAPRCGTPGAPPEA